MKAPARPGPPRPKWRPRVPPRVATYFGERKILRYVVVAGAAAFLAGYVFVALLFFPFGRSAVVTVPDLRGTTEAQARRIVDGHDLSLEKGGELAHPTVGAGRVLAQVPLPGEEVTRGGEVRVILSAGPERRPVPSIEGLGQNDAIALLQQMGFRVRIRLVRDRSPEGTVLGMEPRAGTQVPMPADVILNVSAGPPSVLVPSVVGIAPADAAARLEATGLRLGRIAYDPLSAEPAGRITAQTPAAGDSLRMGSAVRVTVAGPDPTPPEPEPEPEPADEPRQPEPAPERRPAPRDTLRLP